MLTRKHLGAAFSLLAIFLSVAVLAISGAWLIRANDPEMTTVRDFYNNVDRVDFSVLFAASFIGLVSVIIAAFIGKIRSNLRLELGSRELTPGGLERRLSVSTEDVVRSFRDRVDARLLEVTEEISGKIDGQISRMALRKMNSGFDRKIDQLINDATARRLSFERLRRESIERMRTRQVDMVERCIQYSEHSRVNSATYRSYGIVMAVAGSIIAFVSGGIALYSWIVGSMSDMSVYALIARALAVSTAVISCEVIAAVMFSYQAKSLEMMRWFSNEANTIEMKMFAYSAALSGANAEDVAKIANEMAKEERNFILGKDQKTLEMAQMEHESAMLERVTSQFGSIVTPLIEKLGSSSGGAKQA